MSDIKIKLVETSKELNDAKEVRKQVFQKEQGISKKIDFDDKDKEAYHFIVYFKDYPIGTTRLRYLENKVVKIERTSVLQEFRGKNIGSKLIEYVLNFLKKNKEIEKVILNAQEHAKGFYEKLGFKQYGEIFEEAQISHVKMYKELNKK